MSGGWLLFAVWLSAVSFAGLWWWERLAAKRWEELANLWRYQSKENAAKYAAERKRRRDLEAAIPCIGESCPELWTPGESVTFTKDDTP